MASTAACLTPVAPVVGLAPAGTVEGPSPRARRTRSASHARKVDARPRYRWSRQGRAMHFGPDSGELHVRGSGFHEIPTHTTLFVKLLARATTNDQRLLATSSDGRGLILSVGGGTLRLRKGGAGWIDSRIELTHGQWIACAASYRATDGEARFFVYDYSTGMLRYVKAVEATPVLDGDGIVTLNSHISRSRFVGALTSPGVFTTFWTLADFRIYAGLPAAANGPADAAVTAGRPSSASRPSP